MTTAAPALTFQATPTIDWEDLLIAIDDRKVVPVIGRDLLVVPGKDGPSLLHRELARPLAEALGVSLVDLPPEPEIEDVARQFLRQPPVELDRLYVHLRAVLSRFPRAIPAPLAQLAAIAPLSLFVSTTFDDLLELALADAGRAVIDRHYRPREELFDLPAALAAPRAPQGGETHAYHLFGRPSTDTGSCALTDEDTLEFVRELMSKLDPAQGELKNLGLCLSRRHLLFLGCAMPDWLLRFFVRTVRGERFHAERPQSRARVADRRAARDAVLVTFLQQYGTRVYAGDPVEFVAELSRRWNERHAAGQAPRSAPRAAPKGAPAAILAALPEDRATAQAVADRLAQWSIGSVIVPFRSASDTTLRERLDAAGAYAAFLSDRALGAGPEPSDPLLAEWRAVDARSRAADRGALSTFVVTLDDASAKKHRAQRNWGEWLRLARRLHRPAPDDVAWRIAEALLDAQRLGVRLPIRLYVGFADADRAHREQLDSHLASAVGRSIWLSTWHRGKIGAGSARDVWEAEIEGADVIALLVSVSLLTERRDEVERAIALYESRRACVVPILVRSCDWLDTLGALSPLPADQSFIATARDPDAAFREVVQALLFTAFESVLGPRAEPAVSARGLR